MFLSQMIGKDTITVNNIVLKLNAFPVHSMVRKISKFIENLNHNFLVDRI